MSSTRNRKKLFQGRPSRRKRVVEQLERRDLLAADVGDNAMSCETLSFIPITDVEIADSRSRGRQCIVRGAIEDTIHFEVRLPDHGRWNGKFLMFGNGGFAGSIASDMSEGLSRGYATAATDTGHNASGLDGSWALDDPKAIEDYAFRGVHLTATHAKTIWISASFASCFAVSSSRALLGPTRVFV